MVRNAVSNIVLRLISDRHGKCPRMEKCGGGISYMEVSEQCGRCCGGKQFLGYHFGRATNLNPDIFACVLARTFSPTTTAWTEKLATESRLWLRQGLGLGMGSEQKMFRENVPYTLYRWTDSRTGDMW